MPVYLITVLASVALTIIGYIIFRRWEKKDTERMPTEFQQRFPNRCPICSYHDYGVREGFLPPSPPGEHPGCMTKK